MIRRGALAAEVVLALVFVFFVGRLTVHSSSPPEPGAVDIGFSQDMAVHHEQAVLMANLAQSHGGVAVAALADAMLINQSQEIGLMRGWLQLWHRPAAAKSPMSWMNESPSGMSMPGMSMPAAGLGPGSTAMPGMATSAQLSRLAGLKGAAFDVLFLQLMIRHHEGGLEMAQYAQSNAKLSTVRSAAQAMAFQQIEDLGQMRALLAADRGKPLPPP
jgi:uncharacterized protein (DUF305 family)